MGYQIEIIIGKEHERRGVAFLISENNEDKRITGKVAFDRLNIVGQRMLRTRFDAWQIGQLNKPARYHGWNKSEYGGRYTNCFVFKYKLHRFYGFLCNPKEKNPRYQICILVKKATKKEHETDETELKQVENIRSNLAVQRKIRDFFKEKK